MALPVLRPTRVIVAGMCIALLSIPVRAQDVRIVRPASPQPQAEAPRGTAAITGTVVDAATSRPIPGAVVALEERIRGSRSRSHVQVATPTGRFAFVDLPASDTYFLSASKPGYLIGGYGRIDSRGPGAPIALQADQWLGDLRVTITRLGSITGTIVDERGEPIVGAYVRVLPQVVIAGRTRWLAGAVAQTDDRGFYRIPGLGPAKYIVSVPSVQATLPASATLKPPGAGAGTSLADLRAASDAARNEPLLVDRGAGQQLVVGRYTVPPPPTVEGHRTAYSVAFYPSVSTPADATPIDLGAGEDRTNVDLQLRPVRTFRLSGVVQGGPEAVGNLQLRLIPRGLEELGQGSEAATTLTLADGRFTFLDVPAGSYLLSAKHTLLQLTYTSVDDASTALPAPIPFAARSATSMGVAAAPPGVQLSSLQDWADVGEWGELHVELGDRDVDDLVLPLRRPVSLSGRIVWAPGATPSSNSLIPKLEPADGSPSLGLLSPHRGRIGEEGLTFVFDGLIAGEYVLRIGIGSATIESITWDGQDYTDRAFDGSAGRDFTGVVMTLTSARSAVSGTVRDGDATLAASAAVMAFPVDPARWSNYGFNPTRLRSVLTTSDGQFRIDGLPSGEYYLLAVAAAQERAWVDPAFLASHAARASRLRIDRSDAVVSGVTLSLVR